MIPIKPVDNRRRSTRYEFQTEGNYSVFARGNVVQSGSVRTLNLSAGGVLLALDRPAPAGCRLVANLQWPGVYHGVDRVRLIVSGQVVRVNGASAALRIFSHRFQTAESRVTIRGAAYRSLRTLLPPRPAA